MRIIRLLTWKCVGTLDSAQGLRYSSYDRYQESVGCSRLGTPPMEWEPPSSCRRPWWPSGFPARVTGHEKSPTEPSARQVRPSSTSSRHQSRPNPAPSNSDTVSALRGGAGRATGAHPACPVLYLVPASPAPRTAPLGLFGTSEYHLSLFRLSCDRRFDDLGCRHRLRGFTALDGVSSAHIVCRLCSACVPFLAMRNLDVSGFRRRFQGNVHREETAVTWGGAPADPSTNLGQKLGGSG